MDFFSPIFFGYFLIVLFLYYKLNPKFQKYITLIASSVFIGALSVSILAHTYIFILVTYFFCLLIVRNKENNRVKKIIFNSGVVIIIGSLVFFKYINFLLATFIPVIQLIKPETSSVTLQILAPIGISYYTFQAIGYLLQIYRGLENMEKDIIRFANYFLFFPKFLAGPIEQSKNFIPQLQKNYNFDKQNIYDGFLLIIWGAFKKIVIADRLAMLINDVYPNMESMSGNMIFITFLLQPLHLYCDFSGYTDIALGMGRAFGFKLTDNFKRPFFSTSVTEFWQRWHISLSSWCNEYIFKRLTFKNRKWGKWSPVYAVFVTFFVIGIWHGPRWNFIILGLLQGIAINYEFFTKRSRLSIGSKLPKNLVLYTSYALVYLFFCFTLIFFNATEVSDSLYFISHIFSSINLTDFNLNIFTIFDKVIIVASLLLIFTIEFRQEHEKNFFNEIIYWPRWKRLAFVYLLVMIIVYFGSPNQATVYIQF